MKPKFEVGDKVEVLDDSVRGVVQASGKEVITVLLDDGFSMQYHPSELVKIGESLSVTNYEVAQVKKEKEVPKKKKVGAIKPKERNLTFISIT